MRDLGSERLRWSDLRAIVRGLPRESALHRAMHPDAATWGLSEHLMAGAVDALRWLVWSKTRDGQRGRNRPEPIRRPGVNGRGSRMPDDAVTLPVDEMAAMLKRKRK